MKNVVIKLEKTEKNMENEWLVTNGIGGFACGSVNGVPRRKYHSLLNAALAAPYGRTIMLNYVADEIILPNKKSVLLSGIHIKDQNPSIIPEYLAEFRIENGIPTWRYDVDGIVIEKTLFLIHKQNTLSLSYKVISSPEKIEIKWRPYFHFRMNEQGVNTEIPNESYTVHATEHRYEIECPNFPRLRMFNSSLPGFTLDSKNINNVFYELEAHRGYEYLGNLSSPGFFTVTLAANERSTFLVSTESWEIIHALTPSEAWRVEKIRKRNLLKMAGSTNKHPLSAKLVLAADQFLVTPITRYADMVRLQAAGEEVRSVIAGYPWFTDWGRDTMISLEGLTLSTGRSRDAYAILHTFAYYVKDGLIPNMFPDGDVEGIYNTADATLWFFHAISRYIDITGDEDIMEFLLPTLEKIIHAHLEGTRFGIRVDSDGLLIQGQEGLQLTWMDAKVGDWVVTPRRGKAVEINALWYNALKLYEKWSGKQLEVTNKCYNSFNQKFWCEEKGYLYDVINKEEKDSSLRPNQLFAISLTYPVLEQSRWRNVFESAKNELLTPVGLRTLAPHEPNYQPFYDGNLRARDAAYHQGTVWPWLLGPYIDVLLKIYPEDIQSSKDVLNGLKDYLNSDGMGTIAEIFDATPPYQARGCFAQAWSIAEYLRTLLKIQDCEKKLEKN